MMFLTCVQNWVKKLDSWVYDYL